MSPDERYDEDELLEEDRLEPAATDEETARAVREAAEQEAASTEADEASTDARPWVPPAGDERPDVDAEASEADVIEQTQPWR